MGVGVTCPKCRSNFAFFCSNCNSVETEIYESFKLENYFQTRSLYYLKCRTCDAEFDYAICPQCQTKVDPEKPFVTGDRGGGRMKKCFVATVCLGENSPKLGHFYSFRDEVLAKSRLGRKLIHYYYIFSPGLADRLHRSRFLKLVVKNMLILPAYYLSLAAVKIFGFCNNDK